MRRLAVLLLLLPAACGGRRREILAIPDLTLVLCFHSTVDQDPQTAPNPARPPGRWFGSLLFRPGLPVPLFPGQGWTYGYQFDAPQAKRAVEALEEAGLLERLQKGDVQVPAGRAYTLELGSYDTRNGGFTSKWSMLLGWGPGLVKQLQDLRAGLSGSHAKALDALLASLADEAIK